MGEGSDELSGAVIWGMGQEEVGKLIVAAGFEVGGIVHGGCGGD